MHPLSRENLCALLLIALRMLAIEIFFGFGLSFAPGWARGWVFGANQVYATGLTIMLFVVLITLGIMVGSLVSLGFCISVRGRAHTGNIFIASMAFWAILSVGACLWAWPRIYADTLKELANG